MIYLLHHHKSQGKIKDKKHLNLRCLVQVGPVIKEQILSHVCSNTFRDGLAAHRTFPQRDGAVVTTH